MKSRGVSRLVTFFVTQRYRKLLLGVLVLLCVAGLLYYLGYFPEIFSHALSALHTFGIETGGSIESVNIVEQPCKRTEEVVNPVSSNVVENNEIKLGYPHFCEVCRGPCRQPLHSPHVFWGLVGILVSLAVNLIVRG
jgi:hypothetical protein